MIMDAPSDSAAAQPTPIQRVEELWFPDGNLIIQAGSSQFRVYRGLLASRSPVFQDMMSFPQPPDSELVDGCPLVLLPGSEMEVRVFLKAIFDPEFFPPFPSPTEFAIAAGCLRLSHKYGVDYLRRRALVHLSSGCGAKLHHWDLCRYVDESDSANDPLEIYAIQLFREVDALWLLPTVFYNLSFSFAASDQVSEVFHGITYNGVPSALTEFEILKFLVDPSEIAGCATPSECAVERYHVLGDIQRMRPSLGPTVGFRSPISVWEDDGSWEMLEGVCDAFWDQLPQMYGLPPWEELEQMKTAAIGTSFMPRPTRAS
ncbi:hypothetical protein FB45DRAFT_1065523 [Roridomyces roridus]|uniref:BTB domain-containing protein n=1 Tax=Roridomyces roridus TaxID=1738132 RepID=A0AAD7FAE9_9AGAR|nr:hypothetical protein FB45DRAFT_1065523 [Roridomyces roridus]